MKFSPSVSVEQLAGECPALLPTLGYKRNEFQFLPAGPLQPVGEVETHMEMSARIQSNLHLMPEMKRNSRIEGKRKSWANVSPMADRSLACLK